MAGNRTEPWAPDWYFGIEQWSDGLATAFFALLAPAAMACLGVEMVRTRRLPAWTGIVFLVAAVLLFGQYAAFRGALPFPQFLAFAVLGAALLARRRRPAGSRAGAGAGARAGAEAGAGAVLDGDTDGDPADTAGVLGRAEDQGVGPGGDPERFGDLIEQ